MTEASVNGSCFCGTECYQVSGNIGIFQYCHCSRSQKFTGSAFAANLFVLAAETSRLPDLFNIVGGLSITAVIKNV